MNWNCNFFFSAGMHMQREYLTPWRHKTQFFCHQRFSSPSPKLQSLSTLLPQGEVLFFLFTYQNYNYVKYNKEIRWMCSSVSDWLSWSWRDWITVRRSGIILTASIECFAAKRLKYQVTNIIVGVSSTYTLCIIICT